MALCPTLMFFVVVAINLTQARPKTQSTAGSEPTKVNSQETKDPRKVKSVQVENNSDWIVIIVLASVCVVLALVVTLVIVVLVLRRKTASRNIQGDTEASTDPVSNPMAQPKGMAALREEGDGLAVYKNVKREHGDFSTEDKTKTNSTEGSGRYLNEDGLVFVIVELNPVAPKSTIKPATIVRDERYEPVEYSTVVPGQGEEKDETNDEA